MMILMPNPGDHRPNNWYLNMAHEYFFHHLRQIRTQKTVLEHMNMKMTFFLRDHSFLT